jgi:dihydrodipicolinate synthase/N-acetylneuraminate lyase
VLNVVPRSGRQLLRAVDERGDLSLARRIYHGQVLPVFDVLRRSSNPTGTLKAGLCLQGIDVGSPRRPGRALEGEQVAVLERHLHALPYLEASTEKEPAKAR